MKIFDLGIVRSIPDRILVNIHTVEDIICHFTLPRNLDNGLFVDHIFGVITWFMAGCVENIAQENSRNLIRCITSLCTLLTSYIFLLFPQRRSGSNKNVYFSIFYT